MAINCKERQTILTSQAVPGSVEGKVGGALLSSHPTPEQLSPFHFHLTGFFIRSQLLPREESQLHRCPRKAGKGGNLMPFGESHLVYASRLFFSNNGVYLGEASFFLWDKIVKHFHFLSSSPRDMPTKGDWSTLGMECQLVEISYGNRVASDEDISV